ncbi:MAG TPA: hypothetical protein VMZ91_14730 [Candidatus Paceibacterota bacterium]|nr:hypothetical protein [Candidatus Paceibacterota bacterium]
MIAQVLSLLILGLIIFIILAWARKEINKHNGFKGTKKEKRLENRLK